MNICIWGDSITWGPRLPFRVAWANLLRNHLEKNTEDLHSVYDLGIDGDTTRNLLKRLDIEAQSRQPGLIMFNIGVNDSLFRGTEDNQEVPLEEFAMNMESLIEMAKKFTEHVVIVGLVKGSDELTTPLIQSTTGKSYSKKRTALYNQKLKELAKRNHCVFIDINPLLSDQDFDDGLHPNINGHLKIFEKVRQVLDPVLHIESDVFATLVDDVDAVIGMKKIDSIDKSDIVRVSALWMSNENGDVLLSKRPTRKRRDPNRWGPSVACLVEKDHTYVSAIKHSARNESGLHNFVPQEDIKVRVTGENSFFCQLFSYKVDIELSALTLNELETQEVAWFSLDKVQKMYTEAPHLFVQSFGEYLDYYKDR